MPGRPELFARQQLAAEMLAFLQETPLSPDLLWTRDPSFLLHFEAARMQLVRDALRKSGYQPGQSFRILDFGYLHGLFQEFIHRSFPSARFTVCDLPGSPIFRSPEYLRAIQARGYLELLPRNINDLDESMPPYDVIMLGEIIEHLDPTVVASVLAKLRKVVKPGGLLVITTPNGGGLVNCFAIMRDHDLVALHPPIPHESMGYEHIHLWPLSQLRPTAEHFGWKFGDIAYFHGRDAEYFDRSRKTWSSLKHQITVKTLEWMVNRYPKLRGFYVATFTA